MQYIRLAEGLTKYKLIPLNENIWDHVGSNEKDHYVSLYKYNEEHYKMFKATGTVAGIKDTTTNSLIFDFDSKEQIELAQNDANDLVARLLKEGFPKESIQISFTGNKGFCIQVDVNQSFTPEEFKKITFGLADGLPTFDRVVNDSQRLIRLIGTKNQKSGLYKIPLSIEQLTSSSVDEIKKLASNLDNFNEDLLHSWVPSDLPGSVVQLLNTKELEKKSIVSEVHDLNMALKPKWLTEAKFALQNGYFGAGERNTAFMILASTYRNQGFNKDIVYRMLKGVAEVQAARNNVERYSDKELYNNILEVVFNENWKGGSYSYENTPLLQEVTERLGLKKPSAEESPLVHGASISSIFRNFAENIDKNTIKLGIEEIDKDVRITTSMLVGVLAPPSAGKTAISLGILNTLSKMDLEADFYSLDMGAPLVYQRLIQKHTGIDGKKIFELYKANDPRTKDFEKIVEENYKNVRFCFKSGVTVDDIRKHLSERLEKEGRVSKLIVVDYLECLSGPFQDATANTALIANQLKDIANDFSCCVVLLLQPQKMAGDPSDELLSYRKIKGASVIEQACSVIFSLWRPGFSPKHKEDDRFMSIAVLKNRMGELGMYDFYWNGLKGEITSIDDEGIAELKALRKMKEEEKKEDL